MFNPITPQELAPGNVPLLTAFVATGGGLSHPLAQFCGEGAIVSGANPGLPLASPRFVGRRGALILTLR
jgi:hypothetical protein